MSGEPRWVFRWHDQLWHLVWEGAERNGAPVTRCALRVNPAAEHPTPLGTPCERCAEGLLGEPKAQVVADLASVLDVEAELRATTERGESAP